ncbi:helix-turn-helix domain-containing protein [Stagnimonas aquatica]|uniref:helix-turn-helix domain-containing protein n=1 Tax=Stagnimonas aquatica TaxID=2689987 RepID=UPI0011CD5153|nr:helix-turn-helix transcriptional regulator [Stagnimonas aquatica]
MATHEKTQNPIAKRLNEAMARIGISQKALGIRCGIDASVASSRVNHYCTGRHVPNFLLLEKMASVLKVPVAFFYTPDNELARLLASYQLLPVRARKELVRVSEQLVSSLSD